MLPKGIIIDCCCVLLGTNIGCMIKNYVPDRIKQPMNVIFGIAAITIGISSMSKISSLPAVVLALVLGGLVGELVDLDSKIKNVLYSVIKKMNFKINGDQEEYMRFYLLVTVTFCASGTNIFGAISEGISGDFSILLSKATMDIFASIIFATVLGKAMNLIVVPQFLLLCTFFYSAQFFVPLITQEMLSDFIAVGGILTFVLGVNIAKIKQISAVNLIPALIFVWPCSLIFSFIH